MHACTAVSCHTYMCQQTIFPLRCFDVHLVRCAACVGVVSHTDQACMGMLRLVRAFTGREKIVKFDGCYHGHADGFLVQAGSGVATLGLPDSPGK